MNILACIIFKKFANENNKETNRYLTIFVKKTFPLEFKKFEEKYNARWNLNFNTSVNIKEEINLKNTSENQNKIITNNENINKINLNNEINRNICTYENKNKSCFKDNENNSVYYNNNEKNILIKQEEIENEKIENKNFNSNELLNLIKKEYGYNEDEMKKKMLSNLFDENRFEYRIVFRNIISKNLSKNEYEQYCNLREKLFKHKKKKFIKWISFYTRIEPLDLYLIHFFIFLFLDRIYLIIETYIRLNYYKIIDSYEDFVKYIDSFYNFDYILNQLESINLNENNEINKNTFNEMYDKLVKTNKNNFFLSLNLIYNIDIYYFKIKNKISFNEILNIDISSYINESNIYKLINFNKNKENEPWKKFVNYVCNQNQNLKFQTFDCFDVFLIARFKHYLEDFKENANIDYIYKIIKEEYDEVENYVKCRNDNIDFEYSHLIPVYINIKKEVQKAHEYIKFYGNLTSFINFIQQYTNPSNKIKLESSEKHNQQNETKKYFDLSFFLNPIV